MNLDILRTLTKASVTGVTSVTTAVNRCKSRDKLKVTDVTSVTHSTNNVLRHVALSGNSNHVVSRSESHSSHLLHETNDKSFSASKNDSPKKIELYQLVLQVSENHGGGDSHAEINEYIDNVLMSHDIDEALKYFRALKKQDLPVNNRGKSEDAI